MWIVRMSIRDYCMVLEQKNVRTQSQFLKHVSPNCSTKNESSCLLIIFVCRYLTETALTFPPTSYQIDELAREYPGLISLSSVDLSPASWMSIAWYPIYHIPVRLPVKDLSTCFLTYHTLSSSFQGNLQLNNELRISRYLETYGMKPTVF